MGEPSLSQNFWKQWLNLNHCGKVYHTLIKKSSVYSFSFVGVHFVSQYQFKLPSEEELQKALHRFDDQRSKEK